MKSSRQNNISDDPELPIDVEWINGERISLDEYEARLLLQQNQSAARYLLKINPNCNWIFGLPQ
jgi:hypothetical protein